VPYVSTAARERLDLGGDPETTGELNYVISTLLGDYVSRKGLSYTSTSEARSACNDAALEFYCRVVRPYEDAKRDEHGDVYPPEILPMGEWLRSQHVHVQSIIP